MYLETNYKCKVGSRFGELEDALKKSCPQYIGRRFSNARRSAQITPGEVQSMIEHRLDLSNEQTSPLVSDLTWQNISSRSQSQISQELGQPGTGTSAIHSFIKCFFTSIYAP